MEGLPTRPQATLRRRFSPPERPLILAPACSSPPHCRQGRAGHQQWVEPDWAVSVHSVVSSFGGHQAPCTGSSQPARKQRCTTCPAAALLLRLARAASVVSVERWRHSALLRLHVS